MIGYLARLAPVVLRASRAPAGPVSRIHQRVRLSEIDTNLHMNQAVYARVAELGRADWFVRTGAFRRWRAAGLTPMVADQLLVYRRELKPLARYTLDTRATAVDGRLLTLEGHILVGDRVHTKITARLLFVGPDGVLPGESVADLAAPVLTEPLAVQDWRAS
ncbi:MAG: acyl-CoA thioesterase [Myxococcales bacterium]|nr:acyl-CoA thioesterase [Myxococcales bacterium]